jgi:protoporphyrinogen oxidase
VNDPGRVLIVGAGPTGLGAAHRLAELGHDSFTVLEADEVPGGLARSHRDEAGYTWDIGGHVQFSHYAYYDRVLDRLVGGGWLEHERESWIWIRDRFVPYPFQYNVHRLPEADRDRAIAGLERAAADPLKRPPRHFAEWIARTFGDGIGELFMVPYNLKVWGHPLDQLDAGWIGERVAVPDLDRVRRNVRANRDDVSWGPNNRFRFPREGGTGRIWRDVAAALPAQRQRYRATVASVDSRARTLTLEGGETLSWDTLVSTMPLDRLCAITGGLEPATRDAARRLRHSSVHVLGVRLRGPRPAALARKCWMYFPDPASPYYRVTVFSHYSPRNVPAGGDCWSLMAEVCESPHRPVDAASLPARTVEAMRRDRLIAEETEVLGVWRHRQEHGYPTPFLGRDAVLAAVRAGLEPRRIFSRGRFGAWKYEVSNQDHGFMQGVELVDRLLGLGEETTLEDPARANAGAFAQTAAQGSPADDTA